MCLANNLKEVLSNEDMYKLISLGTMFELHDGWGRLAPLRKKYLTLIRRRLLEAPDGEQLYKKFLTGINDIMEVATITQLFVKM